jgi:hypothetical protein
MHEVIIQNRANASTEHFLKAILDSFGIDQVEYASQQRAWFFHSSYDGSYVYTGVVFAKVD